MRAHSCLLLVAAAAAVALCGQSTGVQAQNAVAVATLRGRYSLEGMTGTYRFEQSQPAHTRHHSTQQQATSNHLHAELVGGDVCSWQLAAPAP